MSLYLPFEDQFAKCIEQSDPGKLAVFSRLAVLPSCQLSVLGHIHGERGVVLRERPHYSEEAELLLYILTASFVSPVLLLYVPWHRRTSPSLSLQTELIDLSTVDVILISNYHCMMALPYITEHTGFTGTVYATEPTMQIGR